LTTSGFGCFSYCLRLAQTFLSRTLLFLVRFPLHLYFHFPPFPATFPSAFPFEPGRTPSTPIAFFFFFPCWSVFFFSPPTVPFVFCYPLVGKPFGVLAPFFCVLYFVRFDKQRLPPARVFFVLASCRSLSCFDSPPLCFFCTVSFLLCDLTFFSPHFFSKRSPCFAFPPSCDHPLSPSLGCTVFPNNQAICFAPSPPGSPSPDPGLVFFPPFPCSKDAIPALGPHVSPHSTSVIQLGVFLLSQLCLF